MQFSLIKKSFNSEAALYQGDCTVAPARPLLSTQKKGPSHHFSPEKL